jgi:hypothetical protein
MFLIPKLDRKTWLVRIVSYGLLVAIASLSIHLELDTEIPAAAKVSYSSIAKAKKEFRYNHRQQPEIALTTALVDWTPHFHQYFFSVVNKRTLPTLHPLKSTIIRGPPSNPFC